MIHGAGEFASGLQVAQNCTRSAVEALGVGAERSRKIKVTGLSTALYRHGEVHVDLRIRVTACHLDHGVKLGDREHVERGRHSTSRERVHDRRVEHSVASAGNEDGSDQLFQVADAIVEERVAQQFAGVAVTGFSDDHDPDIQVLLV